MIAPGISSGFYTEWKFVIEAYFDDSGKETDPAGRFPVVAGYFGDTHWWYEFNARWRHLLNQHGLPYLHMREWLRMAAERGWSTVKRNTILLEFVDVIRNAHLVGFGCGVDAEVWLALSAQRRKAFGNAQEFCFQRIVRRVADRMSNARSREFVSLVFDQDLEYAPPRLQLYRHIKNGDPRVAQWFTAISFADMRYYEALQAADLLAWQTRRQLINRAAKQPPTAAFRELLTEIPLIDLEYEGEFWNEEHVERYFPAVEREVSEALAARKARRPAKSSAAAPTASTEREPSA
jgi:hypothetical protein